MTAADAAYDAPATTTDTNTEPVQENWIMKNAMNAALTIAADQILGSLGLTRRQTMPQMGPALGFFVAGALVGGAAVLMLSPKTSEELFDMLEERLQKARERVRQSTSSSSAGADGHNGKQARARNGASAKHEHAEG